MTQQNFLTSLNQAEDIILQVQRKLLNRSDALAICGNDRLSVDLATLASDLWSVRQALETGRAEALNSLIKATEEGSNNMVRAALAVVGKTA